MMVQKFTRDTMLMQISALINNGLGAVISILIARFLLPEGYGLFSLVFSLFFLMEILIDWGLPTTTVFYLARASAQKNWSEIKQVVGFYVKVKLYLGLAFLLGGMILGPFAGKYLYGNQQIGVLALPLFAVPLLILPFELLRAVLLAFRDIKTLTFLESTREITRAAVFLAILFLGRGVSVLVWGHVLVMAAFSLLALVVYRWGRSNVYPTLPPLPEVFRELKTFAVRPYLKQGVFYSADANLHRLVEQTPLLLVSRMNGGVEAGFFRLAMSLAALPAVIFEPIARNLLATLAQIMGRGDLPALRKVYVQVSRNSMIFTALLSLLLYPFIPWLMRVIFGAAFSPAVPAARVLLIASALSGLGLGVKTVYLLLQRIHFSILIKVGLYPLFLLSAWFFVRAAGNLGGAWSYALYLAVLTVISFFLALFLLRGIINRRNPQP